MDRVSPILDQHERPIVHANGKPRPALMDALRNLGRQRTTSQTYDAARDSEEFRRHWSNADGLDADSSNSRVVRHKLLKRSRYEAGSNGFYDGIMDTHANMVVGVGPTLRMLTRNRSFNQFVEREFYLWSQAVQLRRKLWCMSHARIQDGEAFAILQTNPGIANRVQLDLTLIEAEQCQTPHAPFMEVGYIDGIRFDEFGNVLWYDVLPIHPGAANQVVTQNPIRVPPRDVLHWYKLKRPGAHRDVPAMTSTINTGASARRMREAVLAGYESAADLNILIKTALQPNELDPVETMSTMPINKRMMTALPAGWDAYQMKSEFPAATHEAFNRGLVSEQARPISMPYNAAACDSSTYSFASGKLDTLCYRAEIDVERQDCNELVMDRLFVEWFREFRLGDRAAVQDEGFILAIPSHQWDWPTHPVIDAVAEATATDTKLRNGTITLRQVYSDSGQDLEDQIAVMAEDYFGAATDETVAEMRLILLRTHYPVASPPPSGQSAPADPAIVEAMRQVRSLSARLAELESKVA